MSRAPDPLDGFGGNLDAAFDAVPVPDGWVMVPREPTTHAISRGVVALYESIKKDFEASGSGVAAVYRAMIAAAPAVQPLVREDILGAVARGWCAPKNAHKEMDVDLAIDISREVESMLIAHGIAAPGSKP